MRRLLPLLLVLLPAAAAAQEAQQPRKPVTVIVYPILFQLPLYGATMDVPSIPGSGGGSEGETSTTTSAINTAYMGGFEVQARRVFGEFDVLWAKPSVTNDATPRLDVKTDITGVTMKGGFRVYKGLGVTAGTRRLSIDLKTTMGFPQSGVTLEGTVSRAKWNPVVGVDWRQELHRKWTVAVSLDGGGFSGNDWHSRLRARADWQPIPHLDLRFGYQLLHLKFATDDFVLGGVRRSLTTTQNTYGPELGVGITF